MIHAYFIGGSLDLTKRVLPEPQRVQYAWKPENVQWFEEERIDTAVCRKETYVLLGRSHRNRNVYVYEYTGDE